MSLPRWLTGSVVALALALAGSGLWAERAEARIPGRMILGTAMVNPDTGQTYAWKCDGRCTKGDLCCQPRPY